MLLRHNEGSPPEVAESTRRRISFLPASIAAWPRRIIRGSVLQHGLLKGSFVPPTPVRELRDLTRYRVSLAQECNRIANRVQKVLEDANIKLASVATDALGASGRAMLDAMIEGESDSGELAEMSKGLFATREQNSGWHWKVA